MKMKKILLYVFALALVNMALSSCKKDEPYVKPKLSFASATQTVKESDDTAKVSLLFDKPANKDVTLSYTLSGTAGEKSAVQTNYPYDYIDITGGSITVKKGETSGTIELRFLSDFYYEKSETVIITLGANVDVELPTTTTETINLTQEDGKVIELDWKSDGVDMDMFMWIGDDPSSLDIYAGSAYKSTSVDDAYEQIFLPSTITDASFGLSYVYYSGEQSPLDFSVIFVDFKDGKGENSSNWDTFTGQYTTANINEWSSVSDITIVEQTFDKVDGVFKNLTGISIPESGSRTKTSRANSQLTIQKNRIGASLRLLQ